MTHLAQVALLVREYDPAIDFFVNVLKFELVEDAPSMTNDGRPKRWVVVKPPGAETTILLARADGDQQVAIVGKQFAGRVGFFLRVDDFDEMYDRMRSAGVVFVTTPRIEAYGKVAVFLDIEGNRWDLLGPSGKGRPSDTSREQASLGQESFPDCPLCQPRDIVTTLETSLVTAGADSPMVGYVRLVFRRHAVEFHDLTPEETAAFMRDIQKVSAALMKVTGAVKLNYEVLGNKVPHLHMHFFPRHKGDAFEGRLLDPTPVIESLYGPGELPEFQKRLAAALTSDV